MYTSYFTQHSKYAKIYSSNYFILCDYLYNYKIKNNTVFLYLCFPHTIYHNEFVMKFNIHSFMYKLLNDYSWVDPKQKTAFETLRYGNYIQKTT